MQEKVKRGGYDLEISPHIFNPHNEECDICFAKSALSKSHSGENLKNF